MSRRLEAALIGLAFVGVVLFALHPITSADVWWQLAAGEWVLEHGPPATDPFSYAFADRRWIEPRWLYCAVAALTVRVAGINGLILAKLAALLTTFALLASIAPRRARWAVPIGLAAALALMHDRFGVRPELVSFLALALTLRCLEGWRSGEPARRLMVLPAVQLLWNNAHTLWVLGPAVQWLWLAGEWASRRVAPSAATGDRPPIRGLVVAAVASSAIAPLNPWGFDGALLPLRLYSQIRAGHALETLIAEFRGPFSSTFLAADHRTIAIVVVGLVSAAGFVVARRRPAWGRLAVWLAFAVLAVEAMRNVALFGLVAGATLIANLTDTAERRDVAGLRRLALAIPALWLVAILPLVPTDRFYRHQGRVERFGLGVTDRKFPIRALELVRRESLPRPVLHALGDGGYVLFEGGPGSVYVDGRLEVYDGSIVERAARILRAGDGLEREAERLGVETIVLRNRFDERGALVTLQRSPRWRPVYYDHLHVVYVRDGPSTRAAIERLEIDWRDPRPQSVARPAWVAPPDPFDGLWPRVGDAFTDERLGSLLLGMGNDAVARDHLQRALEREPGHPRVRLLLGLMRLARGDRSGAAELLDGLPATLRERSDVRMLEGELAMRADRFDLALEAFAAVRRAAPEDDAALGRFITAALAARRAGEAEQALHEWLRRRPGDVSGWNTLARLQLDRGRTREAAASLRRSLELDQGQPEIRAMLEDTSPGGP